MRIDGRTTVVRSPASGTASAEAVLLRRQRLTPRRSSYYGDGSPTCAPPRGEDFDGKTVESPEDGQGSCASFTRGLASSSRLGFP